MPATEADHLLLSWTQSKLTTSRLKSLEPSLTEPSLSHIPVYPPVPCLQNISRIFCSPHHSILIWAIILSHQNYCKVSNWSPCFHCCVFSTSSQTDPFKSSKAGLALREKPRSSRPHHLSAAPPTSHPLTSAPSALTAVTICEHTSGPLHLLLTSLITAWLAPSLPSGLCSNFILLESLLWPMPLNSNLDSVLFTAVSPVSRSMLKVFVG